MAPAPQGPTEYVSGHILGTINPVHTYAVVFLTQFNHN